LNTHKATSTPVNAETVLRRCASCGMVLTDYVGTRMLRETPATIAMSGTQECAACRLSEYRRSLRDQYSR
jgi:hypothetical protein